MILVRYRHLLSLTANKKEIYNITKNIYDVRQNFKYQVQIILKKNCEIR